MPVAVVPVAEGLVSGQAAVRGDFGGQGHPELVEQTAVASIVVPGLAAALVPAAMAAVVAVELPAGEPGLELAGWGEQELAGPRLAEWLLAS